MSAAPVSFTFGCDARAGIMFEAARPSPITPMRNTAEGMLELAQHFGPPEIPRPVHHLAAVLFVCLGLARIEINHLAVPEDERIHLRGRVLHRVDRAVHRG